MPWTFSPLLCDKPAKIIQFVCKKYVGFPEALQCKKSYNLYSKCSYHALDLCYVIKVHGKHAKIKQFVCKKYVGWCGSLLHDNAANINLYAKCTLPWPFLMWESYKSHTICMQNFVYHIGKAQGILRTFCIQIVCILQIYPVAKAQEILHTFCIQIVWFLQIVFTAKHKVLHVRRFCV